MKWLAFMVMILFSSTIYAQSLDQSYIDYYNPLTNGVGCDSSTLSAALTAIGAANKTLYLTATNRNKVPCTWSLTVSITIPSNVRLLIPFGITANVAAGVTITAEQCVEADDSEWQTGLGVVVQPDTCAESASRYFGPGFTSYVESGCRHPLSGDNTGIIPNCDAWIKYLTAQYLYEPVSEDVSTNVTYTGGDGTFYLAVRLGGVSMPGWTCIDDTPYCWILSATYPTEVNGSLITQVTVIASGVMSSVEYDAPRSPSDWSNVAYVTRFGAKCDGITDDYQSIMDAYNSLPLLGGVLELPSSPYPCRISQGLVFAKRIIFRGAQRRVGDAAGATASPTILEYTGTGGDIITVNKTGVIIENMSLNNIGTAVNGIVIRSALVTVRYVGIVEPTVRFSNAGIQIGDSVTSPHTVLLDGTQITDAGTYCVQAYWTMSYSKIINGRFSGCSVSQVYLGPNQARDLAIRDTDMSTGNASGAHGLFIQNATFPTISRAHMEIANGGYGVYIPDSAGQAENVRFTDGFINCLSGCVGHFYVGILGADLVIERNSLLNNSGGTASYIVTRVNARAVMISDNKFIDTQIPTISTNSRTIVKNNIRTSHAKGFDDGYQRFRKCMTAAVVGNVAPSESTLYTCTIPASTLFNDNDTGLFIRAQGSTTNVAGNKTIRVRIGGTQVWSSGVVSSTGFDTWYTECYGIRSGSSAMRIVCEGRIYPTQTNDIIVEFTGVVGTGWSTDQDITVTAEAGTDSAVTTKGLYVEILN